MALIERPPAAESRCWGAEPEPADRDLVARYREGDVSAMDALVQRYRRPLFSYIYRMAGSRADADEVFQEVWIRAIRGLGRFDSRNFMGWLMRIAHNHLVDRARRRRPDVSLDEDREGGGTLVEALQGAGPDPAARAEAHDIDRRIQEAADRLPESQKEVFLMRVQAELPFRQIAAIQGVSINTALARMHYALARLREWLKEDYAGL